MATYTELNNTLTSARTALDESIKSWNSKLPQYQDWVTTVMPHLFCIDAANNILGNIGSGTDWDKIGIAISDYVDINKIKNPAILNTDFCVGNRFYGDNPATQSADAAVSNLIRIALSPAKERYTDLMAKYTTYNSAKSAVDNYKPSPTELQDLKNSEANRKLRNNIIIVVVVLILIGGGIWAYRKFRKK